MALKLIFRGFFRDFMGNRDFFSFRSKLVMSTVQAHQVEGFDHLNLSKGNYEGIQLPVIFKQEYGKEFKDILDTGTASLYLISDRFKSILEQNNLTGWKTFPIKLYDKKGDEILGYSGFSIIGRCGPISYENAEIIEKRRVPNGPLVKRYKGENIDEDRWDGSDFFMPPETFQMFITKKAADILKKEKITNLEMKNTVDIEIDVDIIKERG